MKLQDVVRAIVTDNYNITDKDIVETVEFLTRTSVLRSPKVFNKLVKKLNEQMEYENAPV